MSSTRFVTTAATIEENNHQTPNTVRSWIGSSPDRVFNCGTGIVMIRVGTEKDEASVASGQPYVGIIDWLHGARLLLAPCRMCGSRRCATDAAALRTAADRAATSRALPRAWTSRCRDLPDPAELFAHEQLDAVSITVPTYLHADVSVRALEAGVHVLCEKPMALSSAEGQRMVDAAARADRYLQIGHCIRFWPEYAKAKKIVADGTYGRVISAAFRRFSATAHTRRGHWFADTARARHALRPAQP